MLNEDQFKKAVALANWAHASEHEWPKGEELRLVCIALLEASEDRERMDALESMLSVDFVMRWQKGSNSLRQEIDAARKAGA